MTRTNRTYATVQVRRDSPAFLAAQKAATGKRGESVNSILREQLDQFQDLRPLVRQAMTAIAEALKEPSGGSYAKVRQILNDHNIYNDDLDGDRAMLRLVQLVGQKVK